VPNPAAWWGLGADVSTAATTDPDQPASGTFIAKATGVLAGRAVAEAVIRTVDPAQTIEWSRRDGDTLIDGDVIGIVRGRAASILVAERTALNFMQRMSGIATAARALAEAAAPARVMETRKTVPGLRLLDKWAVRIGGAENHRMGLWDMAMIKDNHAAAAGGVVRAVEAVEALLAARRGAAPAGGPSAQDDVCIEAEVRNDAEVAEIRDYLLRRRREEAETGRPPTLLRRVMLDNMVTRHDTTGVVDVSALARSVEALRETGVDTEASGNLSVATAGVVGATGVTFVSAGMLTHSVRALDISLLFDAERDLRAGVEL